MPMPFNSQVPHFLEKTRAYCAKVLPLVFDNSLSYYESLCKFMHKLNECIDAINAQNLNIIEFTHMVSLEIEKFETYLENRMTDFENQLKSEWLEFKTELEDEWEAEKEVNRIFRETMTTEFNNFKNLINTNFANLRTELIADLTTFKNNLEEQQDDFEQHILDLQTAFEAREQAARVAYQNNLNNLFDVWKNQTLTYLTNQIDDWEDDTKAELQAYFELYISQQITTETASLQTAINNLNTSLNNERTARQNADDDLQEQINQLTPEGGIKADVPDIHGNSQLYKINQATQQRENIYPVINTDINEDDRLFFNQYIIENTNYFTATTNGKLFARFSNSFTIPANSITYIPNCFKLRIDDMQNVDPAVTTPFNALSMLDISINICYRNETNRTRIGWGILNSSSSGTGYVPRFETIDGHTYLVIPIELISYNAIDSAPGTVELICSFSQYIGGNVAPQNPIVVDDDLSTTSTNPVQNRIVTTALNNRPTLNTVNNLLTTKANQSDLTALTNVVNNKASQTELNILASEVQLLANNEIKSELNLTLNQEQLYKEDQQHNRTNIDPVCSFANKSDRININTVSSSSNSEMSLLIQDPQLSDAIYKTNDIVYNPSNKTLKGGVNTLVDHETHNNINRWRKVCEFSTNGHSNASGQCALSLTILVTDGKYTSPKKGDTLLRIITHKETRSGELYIVNNFTMDFSSGSIVDGNFSYKDPSSFKLTYTVNGSEITYKLWYYVDRTYLSTNFILLSANSAYDARSIVNETTLSMGTLSPDYMNDDGIIATAAVDCTLGIIANDIAGNAKTATKLSGTQTVLYESTTATTIFTLSGLFTDWSAVMIYLTGEWVSGTSGTHGFFVPLKYLKSLGNRGLEDFCGEHQIHFLYVSDDSFRWFEKQAAGAMTYSEVKVIGLY